MSVATYVRHHRKGSMRGVNRGVGNRKRRRRVRNFLNARSDTAANGGIGDTGTVENMDSVDPGTDIITKASHGLSTGQGPFILTTTGTLPGGLELDTYYWVEVIDANTFYLHLYRGGSTEAGARVDFTDAGSGTHSYQLAGDGDFLAFLDYMKQGVGTPAIQDMLSLDQVLDHF